MNHTIIKVSANEFAEAYGLDRDAQFLTHVVRSMETLHPIFRSQRGCADQQAWIDEYARVVHETSQLHQGDPVIYTADAAEFSRWAMDWMA